MGAEDIKIFTDIEIKNSSHAITTDVDIAETAKAAAFFGADGLIVGSWYKKDGQWVNEPYAQRARQLVTAARATQAVSNECRARGA
jgi:predicted TIM-barrel enzyme